MSKKKHIKTLSEDPNLGKILYVSLNPKKVCSFNCVYCDAGPTTRYSVEREMFYPPEEIFNEIKTYIEQNNKPDYLYFTGNGEPSLYLGFQELIEMVIKKYPEMKIAIYSNGSLLNREDVRNCFSLCDRVTINLNSINPEEYFIISRHHKDMNLKNVIKGLKKFRKIFNGYLGISSVIVKGINDNETSLEQLKSTIMKINPNKYWIIGYSEDPKQKISESFKELIKEKFNGVNFKIKLNFR